MIALAGYQFAEYRRGRFWLLPVVGWLLFLIAFYGQVSHHHPGAYARGAVAVLLLGLGLSWTLCLSQQPALWQIAVVSAGGRERAHRSRILLSWLLMVPLSVVFVPVTAAHRLGGSDPWPGLIAGLIWYLLVAAAGCLAGAALGSRTDQRAILPVCIMVALGWLLVL